MVHEQSAVYRLPCSLVVMQSCGMQAAALRRQRVVRLLFGSFFVSGCSGAVLAGEMPPCAHDSQARGTGTPFFVWHSCGCLPSAYVTRHEPRARAGPCHAEVSMSVKRPCMCSYFHHQSPHDSRQMVHAAHHSLISLVQRGLGSRLFVARMTMCWRVCEASAVCLCAVERQVRMLQPLPGQDDLTLPIPCAGMRQL